jgi:hypothetical protein
MSDSVTVNKDDLATIILWAKSSGSYRFKLVHEKVKRLEEALKEADRD